jgi:hypothetical protein
MSAVIDRPSSRRSEAPEEPQAASAGRSRAPAARRKGTIAISAALFVTTVSIALVLLFDHEDLALRHARPVAPIEAQSSALVPGADAPTARLPGSAANFDLPPLRATLIPPEFGCSEAACANGG